MPIAELPGGERMHTEHRYFKTKEEREQFAEWAKQQGYIELRRAKIAAHRAGKDVEQYTITLVHREQIEVDSTLGKG